MIRGGKLTSLVVGCVLAMSAAPLAHADENDNAYVFGVRNVAVSNLCLEKSTLLPTTLPY